MPPDATKALGKGFLTKAYCDCDHAGEKLTRWSRSGFFVMFKMAIFIGL